MNKRNMMVLILCGAFALTGIAAVLILQISDSSNAADERAANQERIEVVVALTCEQHVRAQEGKSPVVKDELDRDGYIKISSGCQRFVDLVNEDLIFAKDRVRLK